LAPQADHDTYRVVMTNSPIQIRNPDVVRDIRALSERLKLPITDAVADAVRRRLAEDDAGKARAKAEKAQRIAAALAAIDALEHAGPPLHDSDLYGPDGFPK
jgi:hypothetical protein